MQMMTGRFHAPNAKTSGEPITLPDDEALHLARVLRLGVGATIAVFDGRGHEWGATVVEVEKQQVRVRIGDATAPAAEPHVAVTLAPAVLKGEKMDDLIRDAVMIGVAAI